MTTLRDGRRTRARSGRGGRPRGSGRVLAVGIALLLAGGVLLMPGLATGQEAEVRTDAGGLGGYTADGVGAPYSVQFFDVTGGSIPTDPGESEFEATEAFTRARLGTGPQSRATASSVWPGGAFGDGFATICECDNEYAVKVDARYPEGPTEDEQAAPQTESGMIARALGLDVYAQATSGSSPNPEGAGYGNSESESIATVVDGVVVSNVDSRVQDFKIGDGAVMAIDSVRTILEATSDGEAAATSGQTAVSGLTIAGTPYTLDEDGLRAGDSTNPPPSNPPSPEQLGITMELVEHEETVEGAQGRRAAGGVIITVDFMSFVEGYQQLQDNTPAEIPFDPLSPPELPGAPGELQDAVDEAYIRTLFPFFTGGPTVRYTLARGSVQAAGTAPFELDPPPPPDFDDTTFSPPTDRSTGMVGPPAFTTSPPSTGTGAPGERGTEVAPPAGDGGDPTLAAAALPPWFEGLPWALIVLGGLLAALGAYGLNGLTVAALGGGSSGFCDSGATKRAPDLREGNHG